MDWGEHGRPVVIAWHGLARTGRDMDELAQHFAERGFRVICPDTIGRGLSQWSPAPDDEYHLAFYARLAAGLLRRAGAGARALGRHLDGRRDRHWSAPAGWWSRA